MIATRPERMADHFMKWHLESLPFPAVLHHFTAPDVGDPHDHPFGFTTHILSGGYVEQIFLPDGTSRTLLRRPGTVHVVRATTVHRITELPTGECWTLILPGPWERKSRFWRFGERIESRAWDDTEWTVHAAERGRMTEPASEREAIASYIDRYLARSIAGPAVRDFGHPVNRRLLEADEIAILKRHLTAIAQSVRAGVAEAEPYWPEATS